LRFLSGLFAHSVARKSAYLFGSRIFFSLLLIIAVTWNLLIAATIHLL
jgi:hypothetical protein